MFDDKDYSRYLMMRWLKGETFINVEHDVVPTIAKLQELWDCPEPWCGCSYRPNFEDRTPYLGCVKISDRFIAAHRNVWEERLWASCDVHLASQAKLPYHWHGDVKHMHRDFVSEFVRFPCPHADCPLR
jgi:hypothetical protein